jgi:hypothetical protein
MIFLQIVWLAVTDIIFLHIYTSCQLQCGQHHERYLFFILYIKGRLNAPLSNPSFHPCMHTWMHLRMNRLDAIAWTHSSCIPIIYHTSSCITCLFIMWKCTYVVGSMWQLSLAVSCYMCREQEWWILPMWSLPAAGRWRFGRLFKLVVVVVRNIYNIIQNINLHFLRVRNRHDQTN